MIFISHNGVETEGILLFLSVLSVRVQFLRISLETSRILMRLICFSLLTSLLQPQIRLFRRLLISLPQRLNRSILVSDINCMNWQMELQSLRLISIRPLRLVQVQISTVFIRLRSLFNLFNWRFLPCSIQNNSFQS